MADLETGRRLSPDDQSNVDMTIAAELERLRIDGLETDGDKVATVHIICQKPGLSNEQQTDLLARVLGLDKNQIVDVFSTGVPDELRPRLDATTAYTMMLLRENEYDYQKIDFILTAPNPNLRKTPYSHFSPPRSPLRCILEGEIELVISAAIASSQT